MYSCSFCLSFSGTVKEFLDLRGYGFAHDKENSFNSHTLTQSKLKSMGEEHSHFFRNFIFTGTRIFNFFKEYFYIICVTVYKFSLSQFLFFSCVS